MDKRDKNTPKEELNMVAFLSLLIPAVILMIAIAWGFLIGLNRTRIRFVCVGASFVIALITAFVVKDIQYDQLAGYLNPLFAGQTGVAAEAWALIQNSQPLQQAILATGGAILAPIAFLIVFLLLSILSWIVCGIIFLCMTIFGKKKVKREPIRIIAYSAVQALLTLFVIVTPIAAYLGCAPTVVQAASDMGVLKATSANSGELSAETLTKSVDEANKMPLVAIYRTLGGKAFCNGLTSVKVGDQTSNLTVELEAIGNFAANIAKLTKTDIKGYGVEESQAIKNMTACFGESILLPTIAGEIIYEATDAWTDASGDGKFLGIAKPEFKDSTTAMFAEPFDHILVAFHNDARNSTALHADLTTLGNIVSILAQDGVFETMGDANTDALVSKLSSGSTIRNLVVELGKNASFKILISDLTNIGMRAIGSTLNIPENAEEIYQQFTGDIAEAMNLLLASDKTSEEKKAVLTAEIKDAFAESGNDLELEDEVIGLYADTLLTDFAGYSSVTGDDVTEFFQVFAEVNASTIPEIEGAAVDSNTTELGSFTVSEERPAYKSPAYAGKSLQQLKESTGAGLLANVMQGVVSAALTSEGDEAVFAEKVQDVLKESYKTFAVANNLSEEDAEQAANIFANSIVLTIDSLEEKHVSNTASMQSPATLKEVTVRVTVEDLLVDGAEATEKLNSDEAVNSEAEAIQNIFGSAGSLISSTTGDNSANDTGSLGAMAGDLGTALDHLSGTASVGEGKTNMLVVAVFQSETVRNSANLDLKSATELANAATARDEATGEKASFADTMGSISAGADIASKLSDPNATLTEEDIEKLLTNMTPQTANMLKIYMTEDRIKGFGVADENTEITTELIQNLLTEMGDKQAYGDSYKEQTNGILTIFQMVSSVSNDENAHEYLFNHNFPEGAVEGSLKMTADEAVKAILDTDMVCNTIMKTRTNHPEWKSNPFGLNLSAENKDHADYQATKAAIEAYYAEHAAEHEDLEEKIYAVADFLGIDHTDLELN